MLETQMKALVKKRAEEGLWLEDVPIPTIAGNEVLIKIHKTAICGTDVHIYNWDDWAQKTIKTPMTAGHEYAGEIVELGANVTGLQVGNIVTKEDLCQQSLGRKLTRYDRSVDVHVSNLRKKLVEAGAHSDILVNLRGTGYLLKPQ